MVEKVVGISALDIIKHQLEDIFRISDWWHKFVRDEITADEFWKVLLEPSFSAEVRAKWLPEEKDLFLKIASDIRRLREYVLKYREGKVKFSELVDVYRELMKNIEKLEKIYAEMAKPGEE